MTSPQSFVDIEPSERLRSLRQKRQKQRQVMARSVRFRALGWEMTGRLTVNLAITLIAMSALVRLIPYFQTQKQVLQETAAAVTRDQAQNKRLRADFTRYFDPAQPSQAMQEKGARKSGEHIPVVLVDPLAPQVDAEE